MNKILNENVYQSFFQYSKELLCVADKKGRFIKLNPAWEETLGYPLSELEGKAYIDFIHPDDIERTIDFARNLIVSNEATEFTNRYLHKDGSFRWFEWRSFPQGDNLYAIARDITAQRQKDQALKQSEKKHKLLFKNMTSASSLHKMLYDKEGNPIDFEYLEINPAYERHTTLLAKEVIGKSMKQIDPSWNDEKIKTYSKVAETGIPTNYINYSEKLDKYFEIFLFSPKKDYFATIFNDVTDRIRNEEELNKFKASIDIAMDAVYWITENGAFDYVNDQACRMLGYTREELLQKNLFEIDPFYSIKTFKENWGKSNKGDTVTLNIETFHIKKDNTLLPVEISSNHFWYKGNEIHVAYARDISERKKQDEILLKNQHLLRNSHRVAHMGSFEINIPASTIHLQDETLEIFGYDKNELEITFDAYTKLIHPDDLLYVKSVLQEVLQTKKFIDHEYRIIRKDGKIRTIQLKGDVKLNTEKEVVRLYGIMQDITDRRKTENKFNELANLNQAILDTVSLGLIFVKDRKVEWVNSAILKMFGYSQNELLGKSTAVFYANEEHYNIIGKKAYEVLVNGGTFFMESPGKHKDGTVFWCQLASKALNPKDITKGSLWTITDINERKQQEEQLKKEKEKAEESELRLQALHNASFGGIAIHDKGIILDCNKSLSDISGYNHEELIGMNGLLLITADNRDLVMSNIVCGYEKPYEVKGVRKNGTEYPLRIEARNIPYKGKQVRSVEFRDITDIKEAESELRKAKELAEESEFFLKESQRVGMVGSYKMDFSKGLMISSDTTNTIFGIDKAHNKTISGWLELIYPDDLEKMNNYLTNEVIGKQQAFDYEYRIVRRNDKAVRWVHGLGNLYFDKQGNLSHMLGTITDTTERKLMEEERRLMNINLENKVKQRTVQLQQANKDLEAFAYSVSHDLRAPIRHIDGFLQLMYNTMKPVSEKADNYYQKIETATQNMSVMIDQLLKFSRLGRAELRLSTVDISKIINEVVDQQKPDYANRTVHWKIKPISFVKGDSGLLRIAIENLIANAIKYTSKNEITEIEICEGISTENSVSFYVKDNGVGFNEAYKNKLFGVFQRLHKQDEFEGIGIGLANVKQIITKHNGTIDASSEKHKGATFYVTLQKADK